MRVLVTGATSMIGAAVVDLLLARGDDVTVMQRHASDRSDVTEVLGDIVDRAAVDRALVRRHIDGVVHLAAKVGVTGRWSAFEAVNIHGTRTLIDAAQSAGVKRFVHISTPSVAHTGDALVGAGAEAAQPDHVQGHYARSKAIAEQMALAQNSGTFHLVALRPHLVWGPGDTQLVQRIIERAEAGRLALVGSGLALIDTTYVDNAASAMVAALDRAPDVAGRAFVISNGQPRTVAEIIHRILVAAGLPPEVKHVPAAVAIGAGAIAERVWEQTEREDDPPMTRFLAEQLSTAHWFDQRETRELLQWTPSISLDEGFQHLAAAHPRSQG